jgi:hypothetical protein
MVAGTSGSRHVRPDGSLAKWCVMPVRGAGTRRPRTGAVWSRRISLFMEIPQVIGCFVSTIMVRSWSGPRYPGTTRTERARASPARRRGAPKLTESSRSVPKYPTIFENLVECGRIPCQHYGEMSDMSLLRGSEAGRRLPADRMARPRTSVVLSFSHALPRGVASVPCRGTAAPRHWVT